METKGSSLNGVRLNHFLAKKAVRLEGLSGHWDVFYRWSSDTWNIKDTLLSHTQMLHLCFICSYWYAQKFPPISRLKAFISIFVGSFLRLLLGAILRRFKWGRPPIKLSLQNWKLPPPYSPANKSTLRIIYGPEVLDQEGAFLLAKTEDEPLFWNKRSKGGAIKIEE